MSFLICAIHLFRLRTVDPNSDAEAPRPRAAVVTYCKQGREAKKGHAIGMYPKGQFYLPTEKTETAD